MFVMWRQHYVQGVSSIINKIHFSVYFVLFLYQINLKHLKVFELLRKSMK